MFFHDIGAFINSFCFHEYFFGINLATPAMKVFPLDNPPLVFFLKHSAFSKKILFFLHRPRPSYNLQNEGPDFANYF